MTSTNPSTAKILNIEHIYLDNDPTVYHLSGYVFIDPRYATVQVYYPCKGEPEGYTLTEITLMPRPHRNASQYYFSIEEALKYVGKWCSVEVSKEGVCISEVRCKATGYCNKKPVKGDFCDNHVCDAPGCSNPRYRAYHKCQTCHPVVP